MTTSDGGDQRLRRGEPRRPRGSPSRRWLVILLTTVLLPLVAWRWLVQIPPGGIEDDGYFYAQVAYNAGVHGRISFDGIHPTDGFHLLWGSLLAAISWVAARVTASKAVHLYLHCAAAIGVLVALADRFGRRPADRLLLVALGLACSLPVETPMVALLYLGFMAAATSSGRAATPAPWSYLLLPIALALTRIDAAPMALVGSGVLLVERRHRDFAWAAGGVVAGVAAQLLLTRSIGGEWFSVAAVVKSGSATLRLPPLLGGPPAYPGRYALLSLLLPLSGLAVWRHARATGEAAPLLLWLGIGAFTVPHLLLSGLRPWYYAPAYLGLTVALISMRESPSAGARRLARAGLGAAWVGAVAFAAVEIASGIRYAEETARVRAFVAEVQRLVPAAAPIFQVDAAGYLGYFSERHVVNGDGLVNTHEYARRLRRGELAGYLDEEGIAYIITDRLESGPIVNVGGLVVQASEVEELARKEGASVNRFTNFVLYRRRGRSPRPEETGACAAGTW